MSWYCDVAPGHPVHAPYHDTEYGFPAWDEAVLFERLCLEIAQAGLSWELVLKKRAGLRARFYDFHVDQVAAMNGGAIAAALQDPGIICNRLKVGAFVHNAQVVQGLRASHGGFAAWLDAHHPRALPDWMRLFKRAFKFTGGEIVNEFLMSLGYLPGAHREDCPVYVAIAAQNPPWMVAR